MIFLQSSNTKESPNVAVIERLSLSITHDSDSKQSRKQYDIIEVYNSLNSSKVMLSFLLER